VICLPNRVHAGRNVDYKYNLKVCQDGILIEWTIFLTWPLLQILILNVISETPLCLRPNVIKVTLLTEIDRDSQFPDTTNNMRQDNPSQIETATES
jgi:hypothetical protein